jgi:hypothetical protein
LSKSKKKKKGVMWFNEETYNVLKKIEFFQINLWGNWCMIWQSLWWIMKSWNFENKKRNWNWKFRQVWILSKEYISDKYILTKLHILWFWFEKNGNHWWHQKSTR